MSASDPTGEEINSVDLDSREIDKRKKIKSYIIVNELFHKLV